MALKDPHQRPAVVAESSLLRDLDDLGFVNTNIFIR